MSTEREHRQVPKDAICGSILNASSTRHALIVSQKVIKGNLLPITNPGISRELSNRYLLLRTSILKHTSGSLMIIRRMKQVILSTDLFQICMRGPCSCWPEMENSAWDPRISRVFSGDWPETISYLSKWMRIFPTIRNSFRR